MKKFFAFAMAIVSMAAVMTSCSNDEADFVAQKAPVAPTTETTPATKQAEPVDSFDGNLYFAATPTQLEIFNNIYVVTAGNETFEVNLENLEETSLEPKYKASQIKQFRAENGEQSMKVLCYKLPASVKNCLNVSAHAKFTVKDGVEMPETFLSIAGMFDKEGNGKLKQTIDVPSDKADQYLNMVNAYTYNLY